VAKVLKTLQAKLPTFETNHLIPNALHALNLNQKPLTPSELFLNIRGRRHDTFAALFIELEGTLDHLNAQELLERIKKAAKDAKMDIVVNFEHLRQATPKALQILVDGKVLSAIKPYARLRYRKLKEAFDTVLEEMKIPDFDLLEEAPRDG
jgi:hypothetical protein